jgi:hypothetical protein
MLALSATCFRHWYPIVARSFNLDAVMQQLTALPGCK